jgi:hypothetical protein
MDRDYTYRGHRNRSRSPVDSYRQRDRWQSKGDISHWDTRRISSALCAIARYPHNRPEGLSVDESGMFSLRNLVEVWAKPHGLSAHQVLEAIKVHMYQDDMRKSLRYSIRTNEGGEMFIRVNPKQQRRRAHYSEEAAPWRQDRAERSDRNHGRNQRQNRSRDSGSPTPEPEDRGRHGVRDELETAACMALKQEIVEMQEKFGGYKRNPDVEMAPKQEIFEPTNWEDIEPKLEDGFPSAPSTTRWEASSASSAIDDNRRLMAAGAKSRPAPVFRQQGSGGYRRLAESASYSIKDED